MEGFFVIAGLGNPGRKYDGSRHNVGFDVIDELVDRYHINNPEHFGKCLMAKGFIEGHKVILMKPLTYMNESGRAIGPLMNFFKLEPEDLIVVHDDMDIPAGTVRIRKKGSAGGHNGIKSVLAHLGDEHFARVRIGIGRPLPGWTVVNHVLAPFTDEDKPKIKEAINYLLPAVECIVKDDVDMAMNKYNPKKQKKKKAAQAAETQEGDTENAAE